MMPYDDDFICHECGEPFVINQDGTAHHVKEGFDIDYDLDIDHTPYALHKE
jgi:hypothetical protein